MSVAVIVFGLVLTVGGILAYTGRWRRWAYPSGYGWCIGFAALFVGVAYVCLGVCLALPSETSPRDALFAVFAVLAVGGIFSIFWMPKFMLPSWFVEGRECVRTIERAARQLRKAARQERKANRGA